MTKSEYNQKVIEELSYSELAKLNQKIYMNPDHVDYYIAYNAGEYDWCWEYLQNHRELLKEETE